MSGSPKCNVQPCLCLRSLTAGGAGSSLKLRRKFDLFSDTGEFIDTAE